MKIICPTCSGKGSIPDPKLVGTTISWSGPHGETVPPVVCQTCGGEGWIHPESGKGL